MIFRQNKELKYTWAVNSYPSIPPAELIGKTDFDLLNREDAFKMTELKKDVLATGRSAKTLIITALDGRTCLLDLIIEPERNQSGSITGVAGVVSFFSLSHKPDEKTDARFHAYQTLKKEHDAEKMKCGDLARQLRNSQTARKSLAVSENRLRNILNNAPQIVYAKNLSGKILVANKTYLAANEMIEKEAPRHAEEETAVRELAERLSINDEEVLNSDTPVEFEQVVKFGNDDQVIYAVQFPLRDDNGEPYGICGICSDITGRVNAEQKLKETLIEKEVLLREIHHRVKNNMQVVSSLLSLQAETIGDESILQVFRESQSRILAMALIHETVYQSASVAEVDLEQYLGGLINALFHMYGAGEHNYSLKLETNGLTLSLEDAVPCGLTLNELLSNSLKHAYPNGGPGEISIKVQRLDNELLQILIGDGGIGMPADFDWRNSSTLGLSLVIRLVEKQLQGKISLLSGAGTWYDIRIPHFIQHSRI